MLITILGIVPVADNKGPEMDASGLVTFFNDMCLLAPATLIDSRIVWEPLDRHAVRASIEDKGQKATATLHFNEQGELVNFVTEDRYYAPIGEAPRKARWSTPVRNYWDLCAGMLPTVGEAISPTPSSPSKQGRTTALLLNAGRVSKALYYNWLRPLLAPRR